MLKPAAVVVVVSLCLILSANAETPPPTPPLALHRAVGAITIDGDLSDPEQSRRGAHGHYGSTTENISRCPPSQSGVKRAYQVRHCSSPITRWPDRS